MMFVLTKNAFVLPLFTPNDSRLTDVLRGRCVPGMYPAGRGAGKSVSVPVSPDSQLALL